MSPRARRVRSPRLGHLAARLVRSLRPRKPSEADLAWVRDVLEPQEWELWAVLAPADRAESLRTARAFVASGRADDPRWLAAALLHDVGKSDAGLGTARRVLATVAAAAAGPHRVGGRMGRYLRHAEIGARMLRAAGARPEVTEWAAVHHDPSRWTDCAIPAEVCEALARADGERPPRVK